MPPNCVCAAPYTVHRSCPRRAHHENPPQKPVFQQPARQVMGQMVTELTELVAATAVLTVLLGLSGAALGAFAGRFGAKELAPSWDAARSTRRSCGSRPEASAT